MKREKKVFNIEIDADLRVFVSTYEDGKVSSTWECNRYDITFYTEMGSRVNVNYGKKSRKVKGHNRLDPVKRKK